VPPPPKPFSCQEVHFHHSFFHDGQNGQMSQEDMGKPGIASAGSAGHHLGLCKPCDFVYRDSCRSGTACKFCHLCGPDENQRRKKEKKRFMKGLQQWQRDPPVANGQFAPVPAGVRLSL
jgi:hypothetical protein